MSVALKKILFPLMPSSVLRMLRGKHYVKKFNELDGTEEPEMKVIHSLVRPGDLVLDVGSNFGTYTKFLSERVGANGHVHAFEPVPEVLGYLKANLSQAEIKNVTAHAFALAHKKGEAQFRIPKFDHSGENFYEAHLTDHKGDITVQTEKLDNLDFSKKINFIKCDVEGAELQVLVGGARRITKDKPAIMLEINDSLKSDKASSIIEFLEELGYQLKYLGDGELSNSESRFQGVNYFFLPK